MNTLSSRERLLRAICCQEVDYAPCCFMSFAVLRKRYGDDLFAVARAEQEMGLDPMLFIPTASRAQRMEHPDLRGLPVRPHPEVGVRTWREEAPGRPGVLHKEYQTPAGPLTTSVQLSEDWPHGDRIPFIDDYQVPRMLKPLVSGPGDLAALQFMLMPPSEQDIAAYRRQALEAQQFAAAHGVLLAGGWGVGMDMANWLCDMQTLMMLTFDQPQFVDDLLEMIHVWNRERMAVVLSGPVDLYIRRAWYEGCDFVTQRFFRQHILPRLKAEVELAHAHGARFGYICTSGTGPLLDLYLEAGIDVLIGIDPIQGTHTDLPRLRQVLGGQVCLWGGVSGAITVERGSEDEVRAAVRTAIQDTGPRRLHPLARGQPHGRRSPDLAQHRPADRRMAVASPT